MQPHPLIFKEVGQTYEDFIITRSIPIEELQVLLLEIEHRPTKAQLIHIVTDDQENAFCLSFCTRPRSSNGVAHILEHTVLCGSEKYPVKDPFFSMARRSLNTYMNALTGSDFTCYPAASQVEKDFFNLLDVYIDAVFFPKLYENSFHQEGHRLEFSNPTDPSSPLEFKGIVYNEMKGSMASMGSRLAEKMNALLYPDITYGFNAGGTPSDILKLTHEELHAFYQAYYHPSRCLFYFYGNLPTCKILDYLSERLLKKAVPLPPLEPVPKQPRFKTPKKLIDSYPSQPQDTAEENTVVCIGWLTCDLMDQETLLALAVIDSCLMDTDASPLKRLLLDSKLCKQVGMSIDVDNAEVPVWITFRGCNIKDSDTIETLLFDGLRTIAQQGIDRALVDSALHQLEFHRSEITGDGFPFGLTLFMRAGLLKQHGVPPENGLKIHSLFEKIHQNLLNDPRYLENVLEKYLINNHHRATLILIPDKDLAAKELAEENENLRQLEKSLTDKQKQALVDQAKELIEFQQELADQDENKLPILTLEDIPLKSQDFPLKGHNDHSLQILYHPCFTNQIVYFDYSLPLCHLEDEELPYLRLLCSLFGQMGCGQRDFKEVLQFLHAHTGGVWASTAIYHHSKRHDIPALQFCLRGKALKQHMGYLGEIFREMALGIHIADQPRLKEILLKKWTALQSSITQNGMRYASNLAASGLHVAGRLNYAWYGLGYYNFIKSIAENIDEKLPQVIEKLQHLQDRLLHGNGCDLVLSCDEKTSQELYEKDYFGLTELPKRSFTPWQPQGPVIPVPNQGRIIPSPVAFTSMIMPTLTYCHPDAPALRIASHLMDNTVLHTEIREKGGAYGGGSHCNLMGGYFSFFGYRDPNICTTLQAFEEALQRIAAQDFSDQDLFEAKLEIIQAMDAPVPPGSRSDVGYTWWKEAKPWQVRQAFREKMIALTPEEVSQAVVTHLLPALKEAITVVFAGQELLESENIRLIHQGKQSLQIFSI